MSRTHPEVHNSPAPDPSLLADVLLRQEPEEEEEEEDGADEDDNNEDGNDGYSE
jgi:hypothetical protein